MVSGFDAIEGLLSGSLTSIFGDTLIPSILIIIGVVIICAFLGMTFDFAMSVGGIMTIGLAYAGWLAPLETTRAIVLVVVALMLTFYYTRVMS